jgi:hypothetical protein
MSRIPMSISGIVTGAGDALERAVSVPMACRIVACYITDTTGYDSRAANQGALTADTPLELTLSPGAVVLAAGAQLKVTVAKGGSGKATEAGVTWLLEPAN